MRVAIGCFSKERLAFFFFLIKELHRHKSPLFSTTTNKYNNKAEEELAGDVWQ